VVIKAIIFDIDGVIIESADIKTKAFEMLFADYPDKLPDMIEYHNRNSGFSRYVKFRHFYENILGLELSPDKEKELGDRFSQLVLEEVIKAPLVAGVAEFLGSNHQRYLYFAVSGTPEEELRYILRQRELGGYFQGVYGAPRTKPELIGKILAENNLSKREAVYIGDAESDKIAAAETGITFVARVKAGGDALLNDCPWKISDFTELGAVIDNISKNSGKGQSGVSIEPER